MLFIMLLLLLSLYLLSSFRRFQQKKIWFIWEFNFSSLQSWADLFTNPLFHHHFGKRFALLTFFTVEPQIYNIFPHSDSSLFIPFLYFSECEALFVQQVEWMLVWWFFFLSFIFQHNETTEEERNSCIQKCTLLYLLSCNFYAWNINALIWINNRIEFCLCF